jgi:hypothetical protein
VGIRPNDEVVLEVRGYILTVSKLETPREGTREGTIEYLFKDYSGERFRMELMNPPSPVGKEKW